jgi:multicomponent Na+:H+ antiporter subunit D
VINQLQLLGLAAMAFTVLMRTGLYPPELHSVNLDADVVYRRLLPAVWRGGQRSVAQLRDRLGPHVETGLAGVATLVTRPFRAEGGLGSPWSTSGMVRWAVLLLGIVLLFSYF